MDSLSPWQLLATVALFPVLISGLAAWVITSSHKRRRGRRDETDQPCGWEERR